jgi:uncharacterized protein (DUF1501 family)
MTMLTRRTLLGALAGCAGAIGLPGSVSFASGRDDRRLFVLVLRGGMDGLGALPPWGDPNYRSARGERAMEAPGSEQGMLDLDGHFGLHPALAPLHGLWTAGHLAAVHAVGLPYVERSHFDAQDVLENGTDTPFARKTGWLNRALTDLDPAAASAMAMGRTVPLILRGPASVTSADPTREARATSKYLETLSDLYASDPVLGPALADGLKATAMLEAHRGETARFERGRGRGDVRRTANIIGSVVAAKEGPRVAVIELSGWDTHANQEGALRRQLDTLANAISGVAEATGDVWDRTAIVAVSEFGRTVRANGTGGTDHGTGGAMILAGGAIAGGQVHSDWPGLGNKHLFEGRDLAQTTDTRSVFKGLLRDHLGVDPQHLEREVFPDSRSAPPLDGLIRSA